MEDGGMAPFPATISVPLCLNLEQEIQDGCYKLINGELQKSPSRHSKPTNRLAAVSVRDVTNLVWINFKRWACGPVRRANPDLKMT